MSATPTSVFADNHGTFLTDHLQFARKQGGVWLTQDNSTASAVDDQGKLHIVADMGSLTYVSEQADGFTVESLGETGSAQSIAIDNTGRTHIAWASIDGVKHAVCER